MIRKEYTLKGKSIIMLDRVKDEAVCVSCGDGTYYRFKIRNLPICLDCYYLHKTSDFWCVTKTRAKREYGLKDHEILLLDSAVVENVKHGGMMRLFLLNDVLNFIKSRDRLARQKQLEEGER